MMVLVAPGVLLHRVPRSKVLVLTERQSFMPERD
jgi:hypothetical protein